MKHFKPLMICLGLAVALPAFAAEEAASVYRGKNEMEAPPTALGDRHGRGGGQGQPLRHPQGP